MYSPPNRHNGGPRYQTLADLALSDAENNSSHQSSPRSRRSARSPRRRISDNGAGGMEDEDDEGPCGCGGGATGRWCLPGAVVALLLILSLICMSEGWLEALGLRQEVHTKDCLSPKFTKSTLKLLHEEPMQRIASGLGHGSETTGKDPSSLRRGREPDLLAHLSGRGIRSSVDLSDYYVVFSNSFFVGKFSSDLRYRRNAAGGADETNKLLPWPGKDIGEPSSFEALAYNASSDTWLFMQEAVVYKGAYVGNVWEVSIDPSTDEIRPLRSCRCSYEFDTIDLGFNGMEVVLHPNGKSYLVGLCESNYCMGGAEARKWGMGRLIVMELVELEDGSCRYDTVSIASVPREANFRDYTDFAIDGHNIAIVSQETSSIWIGTFDLVPETDGVIQLSDTGWVWDFPRNDLCDIKYCNVEGIAWEDSDKVVAVSSRMKDNGKQDFRCWDKAHSVASFSINDKSLYSPDGYPHSASSSSEEDEDL